MFDVTAIGELLIDFTPAGFSAQNHPLYEENPGGAPANVLACLSRLGHRTAFVGKVGRDRFGHDLKSAIDAAGIDTQSLQMTERYPTTLAFVHLDNHGDRSFSFYRHPGADLMLQPDEVPVDRIKNSRIFHFGSVSMTANPAREATRVAVRTAKKAGCVISYDPNLRPMLWTSQNEARSIIESVLPDVDILKLSEEELVFLTGEAVLDQGASDLFSQYNLELILITRGPAGAYGATRTVSALHRAYDVKTIDTTGAGDAFTGSVLDRVLHAKKHFADWNGDELNDVLAFANAAGSLATTRTGAIPAMPERDEIERCMKTELFT
jgi:fructokinase